MTRRKFDRKRWEETLPEGAVVHWLAENRGFAFVPDATEHAASTAVLKELLPKVLGHIKSGGISSDATKDVLALLAWTTARLKEVDEAARKKMVSLAEGLVAIEAEPRRKGAARKLANDPKQAAKVAALILWKEWKAAKHPKLRTTENFAMEVMRRWPVLQSPKVICGWSAQWNKAAKAGKNPVC